MYIVELKFGNIKFEENYAIVTINTGVDVGSEIVNRIIKLINQHFAGRSYCYIDNHINDYSIDPLQTQRLIEETPVRAAAVLALPFFSLQNFLITEMFYKIPILVAGSVEEAKQKLKPFLTGETISQNSQKTVRGEPVESHPLLPDSWRTVYRTS